MNETLTATANDWRPIPPKGSREREALARRAYAGEVERDGDRYRIRTHAEVIAYIAGIGDPRERARLVEERRERLRVLQARWESSGAPVRHRWCDLDALGPDAPPPMLAAAELLRTSVSGDRIVALLGQRGVGKTALAVGAARHAVRVGMTATYITAADLFKRIRHTYTPVVRGQRAESEADVVTAFEEVGLLIIDELHQRGGSEFEQTTLAGIIDARYAALRPTVLIANLTPAEFSASIDPSIASRMQECGVVVTCTWPSFRQTGKATAHEADDWPPVVDGAIANAPKPYCPG